MIGEDFVGFRNPLYYQFRADQQYGGIERNVSLTANSFKHRFVFDLSKIRTCEYVFSQEFLDKECLPRSISAADAGWLYNTLESYHVDKHLAKSLSLEKVKFCFEQIKKKHLNNERFIYNGFSYQIDEEYPKENIFCERVFERMYDEKKKDLGENPYEEGTHEWKVWNASMKCYREPFALGDCIAVEGKKWFLEREVRALNEIEEKLGKYSDPSEALTEVATLEEKEVLIKQKTTNLNIVIAIISCGILAIKKKHFI